MPCNTPMHLEAKESAKSWEKRERYETLSGLPVKDFYGPSDGVADLYQEQLADPGQYPYTRGPHSSMYRGRRWTMRMFAGFGTPEDTNKRFHFLLGQGQTGLSTAFDMPTLMGRDPDDGLSLGEVGREGVSVATIHDMERLFKEIPFDKVSTSMTINAPAIFVVACYVVAAERQGIGPEKLRGTAQNDILKEYIAQKEWIVPVNPAMRIIRDMLVYHTKEMPLWNTISISGYHIREAGATAVQELALTLADGIGYLKAGVEAGLSVDDFAPRLSFFWDVHNDFFEEIAKFRAARRIWARVVKDRFGAQNPRSCMLRTHAQTAGVSLTAQQPYNNVVRTTLQALAAVLGGTQSLHTNSLDETYALPTEEAVTIALRTQQVISEESRVANVVDPLAGSYFIENLTDRMEQEAMTIIDRIEEMGGIEESIEQGYPQKMIAESAYRFQKAVEAGDEVIVGMNKYVAGEEPPIPTLKIDHEVEQRQVSRIQEVRQKRDKEKWNAAMEGLRRACHSEDNLMERVLDCVRAEATIGEVSQVFRDEFGEYRDPAFT